SRFKAPGLAEAREALAEIKLSPEDRQAYERDAHNKRIARSEVLSSFRRGHAEGELKAKREIARGLLLSGTPEKQVAALTGLSASEIGTLADGAKICVR
ncbi:MAG: hypothetical protein LBW77_07175, partial [Verrucomicrobiota bacterium]|nr:hypothetical protein [Verrucomicrobiota bacterium]